MRMIKTYFIVTGLVLNACLLFCMWYLKPFPLSILFFSTTILSIITVCIYENKIKKLKTEIIKKDDNVALVIHDLKNPLIATSKILEGFLRKSPDNNTYKQMLVSTRIMLEMVLSISNTYKYAQNKLELNFQKFDFEELIKEVCLELAYLTDEEKYLKIRVKCENKIICADKMYIRRVISNLISNAIKYRKDNTDVEIMLTSNKTCYDFSVTNNGYYIKPNEREELFEKYVSKNKKFKSVSCGLGLYFSKTVIDEHNGKMYVKSDVNGKNTFGFVLPQNIQSIKYFKKNPAKDLVLHIMKIST